MTVAYLSHIEQLYYILYHGVISMLTDNAMEQIMMCTLSSMLVLIIHSMFAADLQVSMYANCRWPEYFDDPLSFDPSRFDADRPK